MTSAALRTENGWHTPVRADHGAAQLLTAYAVRDRCEQIMDYVEQGESPLFIWHPERLQTAAAYVAATIRQRYPELDVPYHSRWRHFEAGGAQKRDRWGCLLKQIEAAGHDVGREERARIAIDLVIPSVLLDAGAGPDWCYIESPSDAVLSMQSVTLTRSEGLGVASFALFASGAFSADRHQPLRADASALAGLQQETLADAFQVSAKNPLVGLAGRTALMRRLGMVAAATPAVFGSPARLGHLFDYLRDYAQDSAVPGTIEASFILNTLLKALGPLWPATSGRVVLEGVPLGDCWRHHATADGLVPFHKLTQWLVYSLLEPLEAAGLEIRGLDALTGLPEYRNGGLLLDMGLLAPRQHSFWTTAHAVDAPAIIEWRAVTVIALDRLAQAVRGQLGVSAAAFPLARVLEGGTWAAGRRIAAERRVGGGPPVQVRSDGTVF